MKRLKLLLLTGVMMLNINIAMADEGMWILSLLGKNYEQMQKQGFKLTPEDVYNVNKGCLKDAVVGLGNVGAPFRHFCTGEIISDEALFATNHHCGYSAIQAHSSIEFDYLKDGFWAKTKAHELPNETMTASILVRIEDVTNQILAALDGKMTESQRDAKIKEISARLAKEAVEGTDYNAYVADMFSKNQFFIFVYVIYKDVRLVGAPPSSMGKFGGDTDNWMWPRHTADFSLFRIYADANGKPAAYSKNNVPLKPKHFFPVSVRGVEENDFAMIMGFPGTTNRFLSSYGLDETMNITNKLRYEIRTVKIDVMRVQMQASQKVKIQYAAKYAQCSNYWKYSHEQNKALKSLNTMQVKKDFEKKFLDWANTYSEPQYKEALNLLQTAYAGRTRYIAARTYLLEGLLSGGDLPLFTVNNQEMAVFVAALKKGTPAAELRAEIEDLQKSADEFYKDYDPQMEKLVLKALLAYTYKNMDKEFYPTVFTDVLEKKYKGNVDKYVDDMFAKSIFATQEKFNAFLAKPNLKIVENDPIMIAGASFLNAYLGLNADLAKYATDLNKGKRLFEAGVLIMNGNKPIAPDANSTIRLTYGNVLPYDPRDGVAYKYYTTLAGVMEKEIPGDYEFDVPARLKELYAKKDFGQYANKHGELVVNFITNNDITGGNSGSPVIDGEGNLIGLAFDGNSEAMSGDIDFEENLQRCINLDVRYMLFIIDKYAGATHLIQEMKIVK